MSKKSAMDLVQDDVTSFMRAAGQLNAAEELLPTSAAPRLRGGLRWTSRTLEDEASVQRANAASALKNADVVGATAALRVKLMLEELGEVVTALSTADRVGLADGLADLIYVVVGTAVTYDIPLGAVWTAVHAANMNKFVRCTCLDESGVPAPECQQCRGVGVYALRDTSGKVIKPPGWQPPNIAEVLAAVGKDAV